METPWPKWTEIKGKGQLKNSYCSFRLKLKRQTNNLPPLGTSNGKITFPANKIIGRVAKPPLQMTANSAGRTQFSSALLLATEINIQRQLSYGGVF